MEAAMWKWVVLAWHRVTSATAGEYLGKALAVVEAECASAKAWAHKVWSLDGQQSHRLMSAAAAAYERDVAALEALAEHELAAIEHEVDVLRDRAEKLLDAGLAVGDRTVDALCLHAHLSNAAEKAPPAIKG